MDGEYRQDIIEYANRIGKMAAESNLSIALKYHMEVLTDTPASAQQLMQEITAPNAYLYWQPAELPTVEERIESLPIWHHGLPMFTSFIGRTSTTVIH